MVVGDARQHHSLVCGHKRSHSKSEDGVSEDQGEQERIFILDEADEPVSPPRRDGRTALRPSPTPVLDPPLEGVMVWKKPNAVYYHLVTDVITMGGFYFVKVIIEEDRGVSSRTRMILDQGNHVNPGIVISEELF